MESIVSSILSNVTEQMRSFLNDQASQFRTRVIEKATNGCDDIDSDTIEKLSSWFDTTSISSPRAGGKKSLPSPKTGKTDLDRVTVAQLKEKCKARGLAVGGNKAALAERLYGVKPKAKSNEYVISEESEDEEPKKVVKRKKAQLVEAFDSEEEERPKKRRTEKKKSESESDTEKPPKRLTKSKKPRGSEEKPKKTAKTTVPIVEKINKSVKQIQTVKDEFGNQVDPETGLVFDGDEVIGYLGEDGQVLELTKQHMELCKSMNLMYDIPQHVASDSE